MELVAFVTAANGSSDSPAAMATISVPMKEKITMTTPIRTAPKPLGKNHLARLDWSYLQH